MKKTKTKTNKNKTENKRMVYNDLCGIVAIDIAETNVFMLDESTEHKWRYRY